MSIQLSDNFTYKKLLRFTLPSIAMMIFTSIYGVIDGFFVSNFVGKTPFAAVNLIMPFLMIIGSIGFMLGTGGCALVAKTLGEGKKAQANAIFSFLVYVTLACGALFAVLGIVFLKPISILLGAEGAMVDDCVLYGSIILVALPFFMLQYAFQTFFSLAEKPQYGLAVTLAAGFTNIILDTLLVGIFRTGLAGAAAATAISQAVGGIVPLIYFVRKNTSLLRLGRTKFSFSVLLKASSNGLSELLSNISFSLVAILYNIQLMNYAGENGVAAYGVLMYVSMIFSAIFVGFSMGSAPIVGYNYGANNTDELKNVFKKSLVIILISSLAMLVLGEVLAYPLSFVFVGYDEALMGLTLSGFYIFSFSFFFFGLGIYGSSFFTALNNGVVSALISFLRTLVFQVIAVILLPILFGIDGIWFSIVVAELFAAITATVLIIIFRKKYKYL